MGTIEKIVQALIKIFVRSNKRFPQGTELKEIQSQARQVLDGALTRNLDEAKGKNLDDIDVMEKTTEKSGDQLIDDYLSNEEIKGRMTSEPPSFTVVDQRKLPRAEIEALPLKDKEKAEAAVKKKLEAQNIQARQSKQGGESGGGPQRGRPELVDKNFGDTIYIDRRDMQILMGDAQDKFTQADRAIARGDYDEARGILRYEIEDNFKLPQATRDAAYDARVFLRRGEGLAKDMGYDTEEEILEAIKEKVDEGLQTTFPDNYPTFTNPEDASKMKNIEYVDFLDEAGEDFGTPNSIVSTPEDIDYEFATGGRVGFSIGGAGGIMRLINKLIKSKKMGSERAADLIDLMDQAKKAGIPIKTMKDLENFEKQIKKTSGKLYESRKKYPGVEGEKSGLPVILKGKAPKTNLKKVRSRVDADKKNIQELADKNQIPVKDQTDPSLLTTEDLIEFRKTNRAGKGQFTNAEVIIARLENTIRDIKPDDETYEYVTTTFPNFIRELKANPKLAENDNVFNKLMGELPDDQRFIRYDDGTVDFQTKKPSHQFKLREDLDTDRKGPTTSDKKPGMFDDIFDKMYKDFEDTVPGEQPLTKKKRTLNAEGGLNYLLGF